MKCCMPILFSAIQSIQKNIFHRESEIEKRKIIGNTKSKKKTAAAAHNTQTHTKNKEKMKKKIEIKVERSYAISFVFSMVKFFFPPLALYSFMSFFFMNCVYYEGRN